MNRIPQSNGGGNKKTSPKATDNSRYAGSFVKRNRRRIIVGREDKSALNNNDDSNGIEDIEWKVLKKEGSNALVISKYALDCQPYNSFKVDVTWETCTLRTWLNGTFLNIAFNSDESGIILTTNVSADKNPEYDTPAGIDTQDKIFLLSITEAENYFQNDEDRKCVPTEYAVNQGCYASEYNKVDGASACDWQLRSPGEESTAAAYVLYDGSVVNLGTHECNEIGVRPALWINFD